MKKKNVINLIKYYSEHNDAGFRSEAYEIAKYFDSIGDYQLAEYIMALLSDANTFIPQNPMDEFNFFEKVEDSTEPLLLPEVIINDITGIVNAVNHNVGMNKFLLQGAPGTGKTDITGQDEIQEYLRRKHRDNKGYLPLVLEIPVPADYMSIINFYAGDL